VLGCPKHGMYGYAWKKTLTHAYEHVCMYYVRICTSICKCTGTCMCICIYMYACAAYFHYSVHEIYIYIYNTCSHASTFVYEGGSHNTSHMYRPFTSCYMPGATSSVCARSHLTRTQLAIHTLPAITHTSHMHTKPSATCHYSQHLKRREALEHALRQRRDLVVVEKPAQAHTHAHTKGEHVRVLCGLTRSLRSMLVAHVCAKRRICCAIAIF
jgi:hypothetical protein